MTNSVGTPSPPAALTALCLEAGYRVVGIMLRLWSDGPAGANRCCSPAAVDHARIEDGNQIRDFLGRNDVCFQTVGCGRAFRQRAA